jgi:hypothetical protein
MGQTVSSVHPGMQLPIGQMPPHGISQILFSPSVRQSASVVHALNGSPGQAPHACAAPGGLQ